ncbi:hypothetical protein BD324DRAFT_648347 [Kockovaella imperatae]|uniref:Uncharacterized protein n=1 Tax=Kockovaella imperatae TaxID=4999 RepID=A0A1Y1URE7_9TREE|nr:hypothetical protein BD324DRAFT_648347 [Kockovaella imperatae]ORX39715.1 hypothetical protein BD324DRAFT_648347 [Kockovaella imperatae]
MLGSTIPLGFRASTSTLRCLTTGTCRRYASKSGRKTSQPKPNPAGKASSIPSGPKSNQKHPSTSSASPSKAQKSSQQRPSTSTSGTPHQDHAKLKAGTATSAAAKLKVQPPINKSSSSSKPAQKSQPAKGTRTAVLVKAATNPQENDRRSSVIGTATENNGSPPQYASPLPPQSQEEPSSVNTPSSAPPPKLIALTPAKLPPPSLIRPSGHGLSTSNTGLAPSLPTFPAGYRDPSLPRRFRPSTEDEWGWEEIKSDDPNYIVQERFVYCLPTLSSGYATYQIMGGSAFVCFTCIVAFILYQTGEAQRYAQPRDPDSLMGKLMAFPVWLMGTPVFLPLVFTFFAGGIVWLYKGHLKPVKKIIQTRNRLRRLAKDERGKPLPGQETVTTYLVLRNAEGLPKWFRFVSGIQPFREINVNDIQLSWYIKSDRLVRMDITGESRRPLSFNNKILIGFQKPTEPQLKAAERDNEPVIVSVQRLEAVFGRVRG